MEAQNAYARMQYAHKHFSRPQRASYWLTLVFGHCLRWATVGRRDPARRGAEAQALATLTGRAEPPFGAPPGSRSRSARRTRMRRSSRPRPLS